MRKILKISVQACREVKVATWEVLEINGKGMSTCRTSKKYCITFVVDESKAYYSLQTHNFFIRKKRPEDEIQVSKLSLPRLKTFSLGKGGPEKRRSKPFPTQARTRHLLFVSIADA